LMRSRVASATSALSRSASDTVAVETPSSSAMVDSLIFWPRNLPPPTEPKQFRSV